MKKLFLLIFLLSALSGSAQTTLNFTGTTVTVIPSDSGTLLLNNGSGIGLGGVVLLTAANQTITGNLSITGTNNTLPNQLASGTSSIMTRSLADARYLALAGGTVAGNVTVSGTTFEQSFANTSGTMNFTSAAGGISFNGGPLFIHTSISVDSTSLFASGAIMLHGDGSVSAVSYSGDGSALTNVVTVVTGTLVGGSATIGNAGLSGKHPWVQDTNTGTVTNVGPLGVSLSGTTATIKSTNALDTSTFTLFFGNF